MDKSGNPACKKKRKRKQIKYYESYERKDFEKLRVEAYHK